MSDLVDQYGKRFVSSFPKQRHVQVYRPKSGVESSVAGSAAVAGALAVVFAFPAPGSLIDLKSHDSGQKIFHHLQQRIVLHPEIL